MDKRKILTTFIVLLHHPLLSSTSPLASDTRKLLGNETELQAGSAILTHPSPSPAADEFFYNTSRQNIIVILIFWISYIMAYFITSYLVQLPVEEETVLSVTDGMSSTLRRRDSFLSDLSEATSQSPSLLDSPAIDFTTGDLSVLRLSAMRKRRSNLSRIMLLARPNRRFRSLPPPTIKTDDADHINVVSRPFPSGAVSVPSFAIPKTPSRIASASVITLHSDDEVERMPLITPLIVSSMNSDFSSGGGSLLNFIVPEFTVTVIAISLLLQGSILLPTLMALLAKIIQVQSATSVVHLQWRWEWLSLELLCKWWSWLWSAALVTLFVGIPLMWMLLEGRSLKNAPFTRRLAILTARFVAALKRKKLIQPLMGVLVAIISMLLVNIFFGKDQSSLITLNQWNAAVIAFLMTICILSSLICIPLGILTLLRFLQKSVSNEAGQLIRSRLMSTERQIAVLESLHPISDDGSITPPTSTRSAIRKIEDLRLFAGSLRQRIGVSYRTDILKQYLIALPLLILSLIFFSLILYHMIRCLLSFLWTQVLLQLPGIRFIDNIISAILRLFQTKSISSKSQSPLNGITVLITGLYSFFFIGSFSLGVLRLFLRSGRSVAFETPSDETRWIARIPLERMLRYLILLFISVVFGGPVFLLTGLHDKLDGQLGMKGFLSPIVGVMPDGLRLFIRGFGSIKLIGFSMMIWLIVVYRLLLCLALVFVGWKWFRELSRRLTSSLRLQQHAD